MKIAGQIRQVVVALIVRGDEVLICRRRADQPMALKWEFPGGKIEPNEQPVDALKRELQEELGIEAEIGAEVAHFRHQYKRGGMVELAFFRVENFSGELQNMIFAEVRWVKRTELPAYDFLEADKDLIRNISSGLLSF